MVKRAAFHTWIKTFPILSELALLKYPVVNLSTVRLAIRDVPVAALSQNNNEMRSLLSPTSYIPTFKAADRRRQSEEELYIMSFTYASMFLKPSCMGVIYICGMCAIG